MHGCTHTTHTCLQTCLTCVTAGTCKASGASARMSASPCSMMTMIFPWQRHAVWVCYLASQGMCNSLSLSLSVVYSNVHMCWFVCVFSRMIDPTCHRQSHHARTHTNSCKCIIFALKLISGHTVHVCMYIPTMWHSRRMQ